jgi:hypothetical protein
MDENKDTQGHSVHDFLAGTAHLTNEQRMLQALESTLASSQRIELLLTELVDSGKPKLITATMSKPHSQRSK